MKRLIAPVLLAVSLSAHAAPVENHLPRITASPAAPSAGQAFGLEIKGTWPDGCGAGLKSVTSRGFDIVIVMQRPVGQICTDALVGYSLPINPFAQGTSAQAGVYRVRYELTVPDQSSNRLLAFTLVPVTAVGQRALQPEAGYWVAEAGGEFSTSGSGVGFSIERQNTSVVALSNLYDEGGKPLWYFTSGPLNGNVARGDLLTVSGGQPLFSGYRPPDSMDPVGELLMEFTAPTTAVLWFSQPAGAGVIDELKLQPISVHRFNFAYSSVSEVFRGNFVYFSELAGGSGNRYLDFEPVRLGAFNRIGFWNRATEERLECEIAQEKPGTLPKSCQFTRDGQLVATFDQVGYTAMHGRDVAGHPVTLQRL